MPFVHRRWIFFPLLFLLLVLRKAGRVKWFIIFHLYLEFNAYLLKEPVVCENVALKKHIQVETGFLYDVYVAG